MLRNTSWLFGLVIYTGHETKLMMNSTSAPLKRSTIDKLTNTQILMLFLLLLILCLISAVCSALWSNAHDMDNWYLGLRNGSYKMIIFSILYIRFFCLSLKY